MTENNWLGVQGAGATMSAFSAFMGAIAQRQNLRLQADIAEINAQQAERSANARLVAGQREEQSSMLATAAMKGRQRTAFAARNIDLSEGTAARVLRDTDVMGQIDANTIAANAVREAWGYKAQAAGARGQAIVSRGAASAINPYASAGTSLIGSAAGVSDRWFMLRRSGAFSQPGVYTTTPSDAPTNYWGP